VHELDLQGMHIHIFIYICTDAYIPNIYDVYIKIHIGVGKAFGFSVPPRVDLNFSARGNVFCIYIRFNRICEFMHINEYVILIYLHIR
jgi:hypothetical protein